MDYGSAAFNGDHCAHVYARAEYQRLRRIWKQHRALASRSQRRYCGLPNDAT